ncbi:nuclear transport factor 2 family protein [Actinomycetospora atypica]|uniref:Nuclear transport factor 2 family protein n=1 Tax=Actinomycetospora atypica TaxID=1290095 RepID=A0ABV9YI12_9PSEU
MDEGTRRTIDRLLERLLDHDMAGFAAEWAPDGTMDFPFAPTGAPTHLEGRDAVAEYVAGYNTVLAPRRVVDRRLHGTDDPGTVVAEFAVAGDVVPTGEPYEMRYIAVITVGPDGITSYRDYWNPAALPATGRDGKAW